MQGFLYVWFLNLIGLAVPFWKWISSCLFMVGYADCEVGEGYWVRRLQATYIYIQTTIY